MPYNLEAEKYVLGSVMLQNSNMDILNETLEANDFFAESNRELYRAMASFHDGGSSITLVTLSQYLSSNGLLEICGGAGYIASLDQGVPTGVEKFLRETCLIVKQHSQRRRIIHLCDSLSAKAFQTAETPEEIIEGATSTLHELAEGRKRSDLLSVSQIVSSDPGMAERLVYGRLTEGRVKTGFADVDALLSGFGPGELIVLAARPSVGKTALAIQISIEAARSTGDTVAVFSLEMSREAIVSRMLTSEARIDGHRIRVGMLEHGEMVRAFRTLAEISSLPIRIDDTSAITPSQLRSKAGRLAKDRPLSLIVVDYLQLMGTGRRFEKRVDQVTHISQSLKATAKELNVPVLALSQLSRAGEGKQRRRPQLSDLRDSGCLSGDELVHSADSGSYVPIRNFHVSGRVSSLNFAEGSVEAAVCAAAFSTGLNMTYELRTGAGKSVRATKNHRFLTEDGWKRLDHIQVGERIAAPGFLPSPGHFPQLSASEAEFLGHMVGNGCTLPSHSIQYTTFDGDVAQRVAGLASDIFGDRIIPRIKAEGRRGVNPTWFQVYMPASFRLTHGVRNPVSEWLRRFSCFGLRSWEKSVPPVIFQQSVENIAAFLRGLWATDGCLGLSRRPTRGHGIHPSRKPPQSRPFVSFSTASQSLSRGLCSILLRLGCHSRVELVSSAFRSRTTSLVSVDRVQDMRRFCSHVKPCGERRSREMEKLKDRIGADLSDPPAVVWEIVKSAEPWGEEPTFDLTVPGSHNFVANDIFAHNSIEQDADTVMFLHHETPKNEMTEAPSTTLIVGKQRNGPIGECQLAFLSSYTRFENYYQAPEYGGD